MAPFFSSPYSFTQQCLDTTPLHSELTPEPPDRSTCNFESLAIRLSLADLRERPSFYGA